MTMIFKNKTRDEMITWCKQNPGAVVQCCEIDVGMCYRPNYGMCVVYVGKRVDEEPLCSYGLAETYWQVAQWSPVELEDSPALDVPDETVADKRETIADRMAIAGSWETPIPDYVKRAIFGDMKATLGYAGS